MRPRVAAGVLALALAGCERCPPWKPKPYTPVVYEAGYGLGEYSFEPYPVTPDGRPRPDIPPRRDAYRVSPGVRFVASPLRQKYPLMRSVESVQLLLYHRRFVPDTGPSGGGWQVLAAPDAHRIDDFSLDANGDLVATIPGSLAGVIPTAADIRLTYVNANGDRSTVELEQGRGGWQGHRLFFVPTYKVYLGRVRVGIGFDVSDRTIIGETFLGFPAVAPDGWEPYCRTRRMHLGVAGFPGQVEFFDFGAGPTTPRQRYRVRMPATRTGSFDIDYHVVCPAGVEPTGRDVFDAWGELGAYTGGLRRGWPDVSGVEFEPPGSWARP
jgi:hypothetical protein